MQDNTIKRNNNFLIKNTFTFPSFRPLFPQNPHIRAEIVVRAYAVDDESIYGEIILSKTGFATGIQGMLSDDIVLHRKGHELWITGLPATSDCVFRIVDFSGRILKTEMSMNACAYRLSLEGLSGGVYLLQIACEAEHKSFRFILK